VYARTHPNKDERTFDRIVSLLKYLQRLRTLQGFPKIKLYHVISNMNYHDFENMYAIAAETESDTVEFALLDPIPGKTDILLLNDVQLSELRETAEKLRHKICSAEKDLIPLPKIVQFDQFLRRIADKSSLSGNYDQGIIDSFPCYAGWVFSRIIPDGNVNACLKAHRIPVGNINQESFRTLWNSPKQRAFRKETAVCKKASSFFSQIGNDPSVAVGCHKGCDDLGRNLLFHKALGKLNIVERLVLRTVAVICRKNARQR
jgi:MoaA/NifB/PqqE/SkfB family radical SAM enzyme